MKKVLLINQYASATYFAEQLKKNNIYSIAVFTKRINTNKYLAMPPSNFDEQHIVPVDMNIAIESINCQVDFVISGSEYITKFADLLAQKITPQLANSIESSETRGSKYLQQHAIEKYGMVPIKQIKLDLIQMDLSLLKTFTYPVFAKPLNGSASVGIFSAYSEPELITRLIHVPKFCGATTIPITTYLIQEYLSGLELAVDCFSVNGEHFVSGVYSYEKTMLNNIPVFRSLRNVTDDEIYSNAVKFALKCLDACDLKYGFSHLEIIMIGYNDFRLIELNPRISGAHGALNKLITYLGGQSQDQILSLYLHDLNINHAINLAPNYGMCVFIYNHNNIDFNVYKSFKELILINDTPFSVKNKSAISLVDVRKIIILVSTSLDVLERESSQIIAADTI